MLRFDYADLTLHIPVDGTEAVGLRRVIGADEVEEVFAVLRKADARTPSNWSRRFKNHTEMLRSGDVYLQRGTRGLASCGLGRRNGNRRRVEQFCRAGRWNGDSESALLPNGASTAAMRPAQGGAAQGHIRRRKAVRLIQRAHVHVANQRRDFQHKISRRLVNQYGLIAVEDLNVKGLAGGMLAKSVHDAGIGPFLAMLVYKAEWAGRQVVKVDPRGTSQTCVCGARVAKTLAGWPAAARSADCLPAAIISALK